MIALIFSSALLTLTSEKETETEEKFIRIFLSVWKFSRRHHIHNVFGKINIVNWQQDKYSVFYVGLLLLKYNMINAIFILDLPGNITMHKYSLFSVF